MQDADSPPSSEVHTHELTGIEPTGHPCRTSNRYERFRHRGWQGLREATYETLAASGSSPATLSRFAQCGSFAHAWHSPSTRRLVISANTCHSRWCQPCANARRSKIASNLKRLLAGKHLRFITLTIAHHNAPLPDLLTRIWASFKLLRRRADWLSHVTGFAAFVHVKWSEKSSWWHVHLHILCEGSWWAHKELVHAWHTVTADSLVCHIEEVTSEGAVTYASRYAAQPVHLGDVPTVERTTLFASLHHRRLWLTGGSWKAFDLLATEPLPPDLVHLDSLDAIVHRASVGDAVAVAILYAIVGDAAEWVAASPPLDPDDFDFERPPPAPP